MGGVQNVSMRSNLKRSLTCQGLARETNLRGLGNEMTQEIWCRTVIRMTIRPAAWCLVANSDTLVTVASRSEGGLDD